MELVAGNGIRNLIKKIILKISKYSSDNVTT